MNSIGIVFLVLVAWLLCIVFGIRNLKHADKSPHWMWLSLISPIFSLIVFVVSIVLLKSQETQREDERSRQEAENRRRAAERHEAEQSALALRLANLVSDSTRTARDLPNLVQSAENSIDLAEEEFQDGAFAPFWDAVEQSAKELS